MTKLSETILPNGLVTPDNTATLTNKTISGLNNTITDVGLSYVEEVLSSTAPNDSINTVELSAVAPTDNADFALIAKGNGALLRDTPDNTATGGNKRGSNAVDLQSNRSSSSQVASGVGATISGGEDNTASGNYSFAAGGSNTASNNNTVALGFSNIASGFASTAIGFDNTVTGQYAFAAGRINSSTNSYTVALGYNHEVAGASSTALGYENRVDSTYSTAMGAFNIIYSGNYSIVSGQSNITSGSSYGATLGYSNENNGFSTVLLGYNHTTNTSADYAFAVGNGNTLQAYGTVAMGRNHTVGGDYGVAGGFNNAITTIGDYGTAFGSNNTVNSRYATVLGRYGQSHDRISSLTVSALATASYPAQTAFIPMGIETLDTVQYYALQTDTTQTYRYIYTAANSGATFKILVFAHLTSGSTAKGWEITGVVRRGSSGAPVFVGTPTITVIAEDAGASAWTVTLDTNANGSWFPRAFGDPSASVRWSASVWLTEI